jgi:hypothetical protein
VKKAAAAKKLAAAKADSLKKLAAKADSAKRAQTTTTLSTPRIKARSAAIWLLADPTALAAFTSGATHMGGVLGTSKRGDLQKQIDALAPFLARAGISYAEFKAALQESGVEVYDENGRMLPDMLRKFTGVNFGGH